MGLWKILQPEGTDVINLVTNPSAEIDATGFTAVGGSAAQSSAQQRRGQYSLAVTPTAGTADGVFYGSVALTSGQPYTLSVDVKGILGVPYRIFFWSTTEKGAATTFTGTGGWQRVSATITADITANHRLYIVKNNSSNTGVYYVDGLMCVNLDHATSYVDGDQDNCEWDGAKHASTSTRDGQARGAGEEIDLAGLGMYVNTFPGIGMPPARHHALSQALLPGGKFLGRKVLPRTVTLNVDGQGSSQANMHAVRQALIDLVKPDLVKGDQAFILRYYGADSANPLDLHCVYDSGLEFQRQDGFTDQAGVRLIAYDPYWYEDGEKCTAFTFALSDSNANNIFRRYNGVWGSISSAFNATVDALAIGPDGTIYIGGEFTNVGGASGDYIVAYNPVTGTISNLGTGMNNSVYALAVDALGNVYAGGLFTSAGGVANTARIARWNGSAWNAVGTGIGDGTVYALAIGQDGTLYAGGSFTNHGDANGDGISKWNGSAWSSLSTGLSGVCYSLAIGPDGKLYLGGDFVTAGGVTVNRIAKWDGSAFTALGSGAGAASSVYTIEVDAAGNVYIGGDFTAAGGNTCNRIARWNGSGWFPLGSGLDNTCSVIRKDASGLLYAGGIFTTAGGLSVADRVAVWTGSAWAHLPANLPGAAAVVSALCVDDDLYFGYSTSGTAKAAYLNTITNPGTATTYPVISFKRSGGTSAVVEYIRNRTTGATLWLNYALLDGETLTIDLRPGKRSVVSSFFGNVIGRAILRNSDFADFALLPGANSISAFLDNTGATVTALISFKAMHWSADRA